MMDTSAACTPIRDEGNPLSALLDAVTDGIFVVDASWCLTWMNPVAERFFGKSVGQNLWATLPELERTPFALAWRRAMTEAIAISVEAAFPRSDAWVESRAFPSSQGLFVTFRDVTERMEASAERERKLEDETRARASAEQTADRIAVLQALTAQLSSALTPDEVVDIMVTAVMRAVGADSTLVLLPQDGALRQAATRGAHTALAEHYRVIDTGRDDLPAARAFRSGTSEWLANPRRLKDRYPRLAEEFSAVGFGGAVACIALRANDASLGVVVLAWNGPRAFPPDDQIFVEAIAHQCALALDRAFIFSREHAARARAEAGEQRFGAIFQSPMMGLMLTGFDGEVLEANDALLRIIGYDRVDLHRGAIDWRALTPPEFQERNARAEADMKARGYVAPFEKRYLRKDGTQVPVLVASTRIEEQQVNATFVLDISERNRMLEEAQASARRSGFLAEAGRILAGSLDYRATLDSIARLAVPDIADWCAVDMLMPDGDVQRLAVTHTDPAKVAFAEEAARLYPSDRDAKFGLHAVLRTGEPEWMRMIPDALLERAARDERHLEIIRQLGLRSYICVPLKARGVVLGAITFVHAESGRLYDDADLQLAQQLARKASVAVDNARLYSEAQEAIALRDEFLSVASHELKTPLTPLQLRLQGLARDVAKIGNERMAQHMDVAQRQVRKLGTLIDGLLDVSRISAGKLQLEREPLDLGALVADVARFHEQEAARMGSPLTVSRDQVMGQWDRLRLEQVLSNLVSNAIKYGAGNAISVTVRREDETAVVEVQDAGIGIAAGDVARIFDRFERAVSGRNYGGLGLGLYITRRIVDAHGGQIGVRSVPGQGSTFFVRLPLETPA